jgi:YHS domain-containing protein
MMLLAATALWVAVGVVGAGEAEGSRRAEQEALKAYSGLVGAWKGVGQPQRSSSRGAWTETAEWLWRLSADHAALELKVQKGKFLKSAHLKPGSEPGTFTLEATLADGGARTFTGKAGDHDKLVLNADGPPAEGPRRITLTPLHDTRLLILLETQDPDTQAFRRLAEVGYTRQGVAFAAGESYPLCIVTDGRGTIEVKHKGKSYWVCCSGCKDLFEENPAAVIAEAEARRKEKDGGK